MTPADQKRAQLITCIKWLLILGGVSVTVIVVVLLVILKAS